MTLRVPLMGHQQGNGHINCDAIHTMKAQSSDRGNKQAQACQHRKNPRHGYKNKAGTWQFVICYVYKHTNIRRDVNAEKSLDGHPCTGGDGSRLEHGERGKGVWRLWRQTLVEGDRCQAEEAEFCAEF